jgi:hypothetical protein
MTQNRFIPLINTKVGAVPTASALYEGELALNIVDGKLYTRSGSAILHLNRPQSASVDLGQVLVLIQENPIQTPSVQSNEFLLNAGAVSITFTGSINTGIFGTSEYIEPFISTQSYAGASIEYIAQRPGATRMGIIMATWAAGSNLTFTDISTADVGDTGDISFVFLPSGSYYRLRVNSGGTGSGTWTVQSLFKLFPNLGS